jgi:two-component system, OmpR family, sensor kinase
MQRRFWKSITWRVQFWYAIAMALAITGMMVAFQKYERMHRREEVDAVLSEISRPILPLVDPFRPHHGPESRGRRRGGERPRQRPGSGPGGGPGPRRMGETPEAGSGNQRQAPGPRRMGETPDILPSWISGSFWAIAWDRDGNKVHERGQPVPHDVSFIPGRKARELATIHGERRLKIKGPGESTIEIGLPLGPFEADLQRHAWKLAGFGAVLFGIGFLTGWLILRWGLRPLREIGVTASDIAHGDLSRRIDVSSAGMELRDLARVLNEAFARLEKNIQQRERFTADASHELRTPLAVVLGQIQQLLGKEGRASDDREELAHAERAARRMKKLVDELMVLARLDSADESLREPLDLAELGREVTAEMRGLLARRDAGITLDLQPAPVLGDRDALVRVLTNLIGNAAHHNPIGVTIGVKTGMDAQGVFMVVEDDGKGIEPEHRKRLFERFYRVDASRTNHSGGGNSGLGLAICDAIIRQHGGSIGVESETGKGARFTVRMPGR